ncbi:MAG: DUF4058 family protein [Chloroflexi bacterium]|nr:DUF4058 family protein [Chloroflexota bacterium]
MAYPFPGMNPYLERASLWPDLHLELMRNIRLVLAGAVAPRYYVAVEERTYIAARDPESFIGRPDIAVIGSPTLVLAGVAIAPVNGSAVSVIVPVSDEVRERYLEIRERGTDRVITVIEVLSPANKAKGEGRRVYEEKRRTVLDSATHLVEIDLLRGGEPMAVYPQTESDYRILVSRSWERPRSFLYPCNLPDPIPAVPVPLQKGEDAPRLSLGELLPRIYDEARYDLRIDYSTPPPPPPLTDEQSIWLGEVLRD